MTVNIKHLGFILLAVSLIGLPIVAAGQVPGRMPTVGVMSAGAASAPSTAAYGQVRALLDNLTGDALVRDRTAGRTRSV